MLSVLPIWVSPCSGVGVGTQGIPGWRASGVSLRGGTGYRMQGICG